MDNTVVANTTVALGGDITSWLNSLTIPTHDGYEFDKWVITAGYIYSVNDNATVYIMYRTAGGGQGGDPSGDPSGDTPTVRTYVDGDICIQMDNLQGEISGQTQVQVYFSKELNTVSYDSFDVYEIGEGYGTKADATVSANIITFAADEFSVHEFYSFRFVDADGKQLGQSLWDDGLYVTKIKLTFSDNSYKVYEAEKSGGDTPKVITYVNGDGDITVDAIHSGWDFTGSAQIAIQMSKTFDSVEYTSYDIREFNTADSENGTKTDAAISGDIITFTDEKIDTHNYYRIGLFDSSGNRVGQTAWDAGFKPIKITVTVDGTNHEYDIVSNWH